jgi:hypothetical protein
MRLALANFLRNPTPFSVLRGSTLRPPKVAHVQTDGSFKELSYTGVLLRTTLPEEYSLLSTYFDHKNATHSEWCSILDGILFSKRKDQGSVELENDCLPVIQSLASKKQPRDALSAYFYGSITKEMRDLDHFAIRWIPREMNKADDLLRRDKI